MKVKYLLILFLNITIAHAQQIHLQGSIVDAQSGLPIPNATVSIPYKNLFYPTDNDGKYNINDDKIAQTDSISVSCIGYNTQKIRVDNLQPGSIIKLALLVKALQEVKIGINPPALIECGSKMKSKEGWWSLMPLMEAARFMSGSKNKKGIIQSVGFYLGDGGIFDENKGGDVTAPFRVRLYGVDTGGVPGKELTKDIIIVSAKKNNAWFDIDISSYHIENPDSGFFVAFCLLDWKFYKIKKGYESGAPQLPNHSSDYIAPRLGITKNELKEEGQSYLGDNTYWGWQWLKDFFHNSCMIRAAITPD